MGKKKRRKKKLSRFMKYFAAGLVPVVMDMTIAVLKDLADDTESTIDDQFVETLEENQDEIVDMILDEL